MSQPIIQLIYNTHSMLESIQYFLMKSIDFKLRQSTIMEAQSGQKHFLLLLPRFLLRLNPQLSY